MLENKEINYEQNSVIINGVDVSGCTHHYNGWSNLHRDTRPMCDIGYDRECEPKHFECSHYVKCLEKQLKRKEQECERLKEEVSLLKESNSKLQPIEDVSSLEKCYLQQFDQLKDENGGLKEKIMYLESEIDRLNG